MQVYTLDNSEVTQWKKFPSGEVYVRVKDVKKKVMVVGKTQPPGDNLVATLLLLDTLKRNGAKEIGLVLPYFAYGRQDRAERAGECVSALFVIQQLAVAGATRIVTADIHSQRIIETSLIPIENMETADVFAEELKKIGVNSTWNIVAPDKGGKNRAERLAEALRVAPVAWITKERTSDGEAKAKAIHGKLAGTSAVIVDDMIDTGGTLAEAVRLLRGQGIQEIIVCATHPIFSGPAVERVAALHLKRIIVTNTLPLPLAARHLKNLTVVTVAYACT